MGFFHDNLLTLWITNNSHIIPTHLILTSHSSAFHLISLDSHCIFTSVTSLLPPFLPSICPTLAVGRAYLYQAVACVAVPQSFLLDMLSCQAWNCSLSSPKNNYWKRLHH